MGQDTPIINATFSYVQQEEFGRHPDIKVGTAAPPVMQKNRAKRLKQAVNDLCIGKRIQTELKRQGRTVTWLAQQLCMERTSLYYTFRQNSIDMELLMRISAFTEHDFFAGCGGCIQGLWTLI